MIDQCLKIIHLLKTYYCISYQYLSYPHNSLREVYFIPIQCTRVRRWVPFVMQELLILILQKHPRSPRFSVVFGLLDDSFFAQCFIDHCLLFGSLSFDHWIVYLSYGFRIPIWYLQTFLKSLNNNSSDPIHHGIFNCAILNMYVAIIIHTIYNIISISGSLKNISITIFPIEAMHIDSIILTYNVQSDFPPVFSPLILIFIGTRYVHIMIIMGQWLHWIKHDQRLYDSTHMKGFLKDISVKRTIVLSDYRINGTSDYRGNRQQIGPADNPCGPTLKQQNTILTIDLLYILI